MQPNLITICSRRRAVVRRQLRRQAYGMACGCLPRALYGFKGVGAGVVAGWVCAALMA